MSLQHTILGFLSWKPLTGYEIKKFFSDTDFIHWSGNNNQIYKTLVQLSASGFVSKEVVQQENYPAKKVYHITPEGKSEVRRWATSTPEFPQVKNTFLMQLAWSDGLDVSVIEKIIDEYQYKIDMRLVMCKEKLQRRIVIPDRTEREEYIWEMIWQKEIDLYQNELNWLTTIKNGIRQKEGKNE